MATCNFNYRSLEFFVLNFILSDLVTLLNTIEQSSVTGINNQILLPPTNEGNVFIGVCLSTGGGGALSMVGLSPGGSLSREGLCPGGSLSRGVSLR